MNAKRRRELNKIIETLNETVSQLGDLESEERDAADNMPESMWGTEKHERLEENGDTLSDCIQDIEDVIGNLEEVV